MRGNKENNKIHRIEHSIACCDEEVADLRWADVGDGRRIDETLGECFVAKEEQ